jgi:hypothetical protein
VKFIVASELQGDSFRVEREFILARSIREYKTKSARALRRATRCRKW